MKYKILGYVFIAITVLAITSGIYYWQVKNQTSEYIQPITHVDPTVSWKTYTNEEYGFGLKHPSTWKITETDDGGIMINPSDFVYPKNGTIDSYFSFNQTAHLYQGEEQAVLKMFGSKQGYVYEIDKSVYFPSETGVGGYIVRYNRSDEAKKVLATLKFSEMITKTYINKQYGFELKYPYGYLLTENDKGILIESSTSCETIRMAASGQWPKDCYSFSLLIQKNKIDAQIIGIDVKIAGYSSEKFEINDGMWESANQTYYQFEKGGNWYINYLTFNSENKIAGENLLSQILSTFKFTK